MKLTITDDTASGRIPPNHRMLTTIYPQMEGRRTWTKAGVFVFEATQHNLDLITDAFPSALIERTDSKPFSGVQPPSTVGRPAYELKTQPFREQSVCSSRLEGQSTFAVFGEQGTGKTKVAIDYAGKLWAENRIDAVLVLAPKGVHQQWVYQQIPEHLGDSVERRAVAWQGKLPKDFQTILLRSGPLCWYTINYDAIRNKRGMESADTFCAFHNQRLLIIADESHNIKNTRTARWKAAATLTRYSVARLILSGTPIAKDLTDEWSQLNWLNPSILGMKYVTTFRAEYCVMGGFENRQVIGHRNIERFRSRVDPYSFRMTKKDLGLPPKIHNHWTFEMTPKQRQMIRDLKDDLITQIDNGSIVSAANAAVAAAKFQQISRGFIIEKIEPENGKPYNVVHDIMPANKNPSLLALGEILDNYGDLRVVIWAHHVHDIERIMDLLGDKAASYHGATSDEERQYAVREFTAKDGNLQYFVANQAAGGTGLNLQFHCNKAIYYSNSYRAIDRWQSEDRIHRIGTTLPVTYTDLVGKGSKDRGILANIRRKKAISEMGIGELRRWLEDD